MSKSIHNVLLAAICGTALLMTGCSWGAGQSKNTKSAEYKKKSKTKLICHRDAPTGSHITQMVCYRRADVDDRRGTDRERVRNMQIGGAINPNPTSN